MSFINIFFPKTIYFQDTPYNKNISVTKSYGEPTLIVNGLVESGKILTNIWDTAIKKLLPKTFYPQKILLLGLGGGSNATLVHKYFPNAAITAVEIDPQMVEIANEHFRLSRIPQIKILIEDALDFSLGLTKKDFFDLVLVDCFVGKFIPKKFERLDFLESLYSHSRYTLINRIWYNEHHLSTVFFMRKLSSKFFFVKAHNQTNAILSLV